MTSEKIQKPVKLTKAGVPHKPRSGRPSKPIDLTVVEGLGRIQCTIKECAAFLSIPEDTLRARKDFQASWKKGLETGKISLRRIQFRMAEKSAAMAIWLGKQYLGQMEKVFQYTYQTEADDVAFRDGFFGIGKNNNGNGHDYKEKYKKRSRELKTIKNDPNG